MGKLIAAIMKELVLLSRDRSGLLVLFLMPAVLVTVVSLVQENVLKTSGEIKLKALLVQQDDHAIGRLIEKALQQVDAIELIKEIDGQDIDEDKAQGLLNKGAFQLCVIIPKGLTEAVNKRLEQQFTGTLNGGGRNQEPPAELPGLIVYFDPLVQSGFRMAVENLLHRVVATLETEMKADAFSKTVSEQVNRTFQEMKQIDLRGFSFVLPPWNRERLLDVKAHHALPGANRILPTTVQQNVPAWTLFGMFFIVVPLGGALIREKQDGTLARSLTLPVPYGILLSGKVIAYVFICTVQFGVIVLVGKYVLPSLGTPPLEINSSPAVILFVIVSAALAAAGYGVLLGTLFQTYEQVSMFGPVSIVIAAALGGIMVPVNLMPEFMQTISAYSPLGWGLNALLDLFVRQGNMKTVLTEVLYLVTFAAGTLVIAWGAFMYGARPRH